MELTDAVSAVAAAVDALQTTSFDSGSATGLRSSLKALKTADSKLQAQLGRLTHAADKAGSHIGTGARDSAEWLGRETGTSTSRNRAGARLGEAMERSAPLADAVTGGGLSSDKASLVVGAAGDARVDTELIEEVSDLPLNSVRPAVESWRARNHPDRDADIAATQRVRRYLRLSDAPDGMTRIDGLLDPESGAIVRSALDGLMNESFADSTHRTRDQRCADALTQVCAAVAKGEIRGGRSNTKLLVTAPFETVVERGGRRGTTNVGATLDAETVRKMACDAGIHRVITGPGSSIIDFGHETRLVSENLFLALVARDQYCRWPGCTTRATWCDAHHIIHWADDGVTDDENCVLLCHHHHQLSHQPGWQMTGNSTELRIEHPDGSVQLSSPPEIGRAPGGSHSRAGKSPPKSGAPPGSGPRQGGLPGRSTAADEAPGDQSPLEVKSQQLTLA